MKNLILIASLLFGATAVLAQSKVAHLNSQEVMAASPSYNNAVASLKKYENDAYTELQIMANDFEKALVDYQKKAPDLSPVLRKIEEEKLAKKEQAYTQRQQAIQQEIDAYSRELNLPIIELVEKAVKIVSDRNKYDYVFDVSVLMIHNGTDITQDVIKEIRILDTQESAPPQEDVRP